MRIYTGGQRFFNSTANFKHVQNFLTNLNNRSCWFRMCTNPNTKGNYHLLSVTIANDIEKNAIASHISGNSVRCEGAINKDMISITLIVTESEKNVFHPSLV